MTESADREPREGASSGGEEPVEAVGTYETGEATVFYDTENPLAWVQSGTTVRLEEMA